MSSTLPLPRSSLGAAQAHSQAGRPSRAAWLRRTWLGVLLRTRLAGFGLVLVLVMVVFAILADTLTPYDPNEQHYAQVLQAPSAAYIFGTDDLGRDVYSRLVYGARVSLEVGLLAASIAVLVGTLIGLIAGYNGGGWIEEVLMRTMDGLRAFPGLVLALSINAVLGPGTGNVIIGGGVVSIPTFARLAHAQTLSAREREYVTAARVVGVGA